MKNHDPSPKHDLNLTQTNPDNRSKDHLGKQGLKFVLVGLCAALVHFLLLWFWVQIWQISPSWANVLAFLGAFVVSFLGHFFITFAPNLQQKSRRSFWQSLLKWFVSAVSGFALNQGLFVLGIDLLGQAYYLLIWLVATGLVMMFSFIVGKIWAFR